METRTLSQTLVRNTVIISTFNDQVESLRSNYVSQQQEVIRNEVEKAVDFIHYMQAATEDRLKQQLQEQTEALFSVL